MNFIAVYDPRNTAKTDTLVLDAVLTEEHSLENTVTAFPREDGAVMNDHIVNAPRKVTIQGLITDSPVWDPLATEIPKGTRVSKAFSDLEKLHADRKTVTVVTRLKTYENMAIERISIPRAAATGRALEFSVSLVEIKTAVTRAVALESKKTSSEGDQPVMNAGKQNPGTPAPGAAKNVSAA